MHRLPTAGIDVLHCLHLRQRRVLLLHSVTLLPGSGVIRIEKDVAAYSHSLLSIHQFSGDALLSWRQGGEYISITLARSIKILCFNCLLSGTL